MRIVSWNMGRKIGTWEYVRRHLKPDVAMLQESAPVNQDIEPCVSTIDINKRVRNSIYVKDGKFEDIKLPTEKFKHLSANWGTGIQAVKIHNPVVGNIILINVHGNQDFIGGLDIVLTGVLNLYIQIFKTIQKKEHIIMAGDFNIDRRMDDNSTDTIFSKPGEGRSNIFFDTILKNGFKDCVQKYCPNYVRTYRHQKKDDSSEGQLDHMFATPALFDSLKNLKVFETAKVKKLSDHNPIVADFDI